MGFLRLLNRAFIGARSLLIGHIQLLTKCVPPAGLSLEPQKEGHMKSAFVVSPPPGLNERIFEPELGSMQNRTNFSIYSEALSRV